jgi:adenine/guanine phosphoribosyltransferase-like PRPP-binding protein
MDELRRIIRDVPDFPRKSRLQRHYAASRDPEAFKKAIDLMAEPLRSRFDLLVGIRPRIHFRGARHALGKGKVPVRKPEAPARRSVSYQLVQVGPAQMHEMRSIPASEWSSWTTCSQPGGERAASLVEKVGAGVGLSFIGSTS